MFFLSLICLATAVVAQNDDDISSIINETYTGPIRPARVLLDSEERNCTCVPFYHCTRDKIALHTTNSSVSGFGVIEARAQMCLGDNDVCCTRPRIGCGYRNPNGVDVNNHAHTDSQAHFGEFPWVVGVLESGIYYGVGALVHPRVVITAGHIAAGLDVQKLLVVAGDWDTTTDTENLRPQIQTVNEIYMHEGQQGADENDVALLLLNQEFKQDHHINVICMPSQNEDFSQNKGCIVNGWGLEFVNGRERFAQILKRIDVNMVESGRCQTQLKEVIGDSFNLHSSFVCAAGDSKTGQCITEGDGGAPLVCPTGNDRYVLTGLGVKGVKCGQNKPALYTNVANFRQWVDDKIIAWGLTTLN